MLCVGNLQNILHPPILAKVRLAMVYVARGITPLSQWLVSSFTESSHLTFLSSAGGSLSGQLLWARVDVHHCSRPLCTFHFLRITHDEIYGTARPSKAPDYPGDLP